MLSSPVNVSYIYGTSLSKIEGYRTIVGKIKLNRGKNGIASHDEKIFYKIFHSNSQLHIWAV